MSKKFSIVNPFNHNVVFCIDKELNKECILLGSGIGFGVKENQLIKASNKIEKIFYLIDKSNMYKFAGLSKEVDENIIGVTEEIILMAHSELHKELDERIHITLIDHIAFTIDRFKNDMSIVNPFLVEIKNLYKAEYIVALKALNLINERLGISLPEDEVGFIAMHFHAAVNKVNVSKTAKSTAVINEIISGLEDRLGRSIDKESIDYVRLITHIRFALDRVEKNIPIKNILLSDIKEKFNKSYSIALEVSQEIKNNFEIILPEDEIGYLAIHIEKLQTF
jgi:transcriptional antiterminator